MRRALVTVAFALIAGGCDAPEHPIIVNLRTDLAPADEWYSVELLLSTDGGSSVGGEEVLADSGVDYMSAVRLAELGPVPEGRYRLDVRMRLLDGRFVARRTVSVDVQTATSVTVLLDRRCVGVECPSDEACLGGLCVDDRCTEEAGETCPPPECTTDSECAAPAACAGGAACVADRCLVTLGTPCQPAEYCHAELGCSPIGPALPGGDGGVDAGASDAGTDAGLPDFTNGTHERSGRFGNDVDLAITAIAARADGSHCVGGAFRGSWAAAPGPTLISAGLEDGFVLCFASDGSPAWAVGIGGAQADTVTDVAIAPGGDVVVTGQFRDSITSLCNPISSGGRSDLFVARFDASGACRWVISDGSTLSDTPNDLAVDASGNAYVVGSFQGTGSYAGLPASSRGRIDLFVASYDVDGAPRWGYVAGGAETDTASRVTVSGATVTVAGTFIETADFPGAGSFISISLQSDIFVLRLARADGAALGARQYGNSDADRVTGLTADAAGNTFMTGPAANSALDFGGGPLMTGPYAYLVSFDASGAHRWSRVIGTGVHQNADLQVGLGGHLYLTQGYAGSLQFEGRLVLAQGTDVLIASFETATGVGRWARVFGGPGVQRSVDGALSGTRVIVAGHLTEVSDFGGGTIAPTTGVDGFVLEVSE